MRPKTNDWIYFSRLKSLKTVWKSLTKFKYSSKATGQCHTLHKSIKFNMDFSSAKIAHKLEICQNLARLKYNNSYFYIYIEREKSFLMCL